MTHSATASQWSSRIGFILASAGSAIGLGAIWKFPYWAGANGGAAFILPYVLFTFTVGVALVMAETAIGRLGRGCAAVSMGRAGGPVFALTGAAAVFTAFLILSYYAVVGGWCVSYLLDAIAGQAVSADAVTLRERFGDLVETGGRSVVWLFVFLLMTCGTVIFGVERGIERLSRILMPALFVLMLCLTVRSLTLPGAAAGVEYLLHFSPEDLTPEAILNAMGYTFFSLSLGAGILVTYGAYLPRETRIPGASMWVAALSVQASLLAGLTIMPAVFAFGLAPDAGPGLVFVTIPLVFSQLPLGGLLAALFYVCLVVVALTSSVSLLEVVVAHMTGRWHLSRRRAVVAAFAALFAAGCVPALSFGPWSDWRIFGRTAFDFLDFVCSNLLMPAGGLAVALLAGRSAWPAVAAELSSPACRPGTIAVVRVLLRRLAPVLVAVACLQSLLG